MTDDEFLQAFHDFTLPNEQFRHRDHVQLAWLAVTRLGGEAALPAVSQRVRRFAEAHGHTGLYHETMTRFWLRIIDHAVRARPDIRTFDAFTAEFPWLLDSSLPYRHWRRETMMSPEARGGWVEPDLLDLPEA
jgi:hypothetical protein